MKTRRFSTLAVLTAALFVLLLMPVPSARGDPFHNAAVDPAAPNSLMQFTSHGHVLGFSVGKFYVSNGTYALHVEFLGANAIAPVSDTPSALNGLRTPTLSRVTYANLWEGIALAYDAARGGVVSSSYRLEPQADLRAIHLRYNAPVTLNSDGTLTIAYTTGQMVESAPLAWQQVAGVRVPVSIAFVLRGEREVGFAVDEYDAAQPLFIDPTLAWNTFLGGSGDDYGHGIAVDGSGNIYMTGSSTATWGSPVITYTAGIDAFVAKLDSSGSLTWNTFLGGSLDDVGFGIAVDESGNVYVTGYSSATWGSPVRAYGGGPNDAFAVKLNSSGSLTWNTFLGGSGGDAGYGIVIDGSGNVYVAGYSTATWESPIRAYTSSNDAFAAKLGSNGALMWNTFLGGSGIDLGFAIAVAGSGNVYVTGYSGATWETPIRAFTSGYDAFVAKLDSGGALKWNTFLGASGTDFGNDIAVDGSENVYVAGYSNATWETPIRPFSGWPRDAYVAKLDSSGNLTWNTFLGGFGDDTVVGIALDGSGSVYVAGSSNSSWGLPLHPYTGGIDAFAAKLDSNGVLTWHTFLGGGGDDYGQRIAVDGSENVYMAGYSNSTWGLPVRAYTSGVDAFVAKVHISSLYLPLIVK